MGFKIFDNTVFQSLHRKRAHFAAQEMTFRGKLFQESTEHRRLLLHEIEERLAVDVPHDAVGNGGNFDRNNVGCGEEECRSQQHWGIEMVHEQLAALIPHHPCLGLSFDKHHQRTARVASIEHTSARRIFLTATRAFEKAFQSIVAASRKELDSF